MSLNPIPTELPGVVVFQPRLYRDPRGYFLESYQASRYADAGIPARFIQDNISRSEPGVLRGLHLQSPSAQAKLVMVLTGSIFDVAVDVRVGSPTFGRWTGRALSADDHRQMYIPAGFAHGFVVTSDVPALVSYKVDGPYVPGDELTLAWDDPELAIAWPVARPTLSSKDREGLRLRDLPAGRLPVFDPTAPNSA